MRVNVSHLTYRYKDAPQPALQDISFTLEHGERVCLLGVSGSGKTTLLLALSGLLPPSSGCVAYAGAPAGRARRKWVRRRVAIAFQQPEKQLYAKTALADCMSGPLCLGYTTVAAKTAAVESLSALGINVERAARESPFQFSGGERRLIALAGVLAMRPRLLLLDEPTAGLDIHSKRRLLAALAQAGADGCTCVLATHDISLAADFAQRLLVLQQGRLVLNAHPDWLFARYDAARKCGLAQLPLDHLAAALHTESGYHLPARRWQPADLAAAVAAQLRGAQP